MRTLWWLALGGTLFLSACAVKRPAVESADPVAADAEPVPEGETLDERFAGVLQLMKTRQYDEAEQRLVALSNEFPQYSGLHTNLGIVRAQKKQWNTAAASLSQAVRINASNAVAHNWLGVVYRESGNYPQAREAYEAAIAAAPDYSAAHLNLGMLLDQYLRQPDAALQHYQRYRDLGGEDDLRVHVWMAQIQAAQAQAQQAAAEQEVDVK